ncbi:16S rRNA (guanine(527)-N(7))-methyltransferase RsmG [Salipaludibacillus keqinensis]|uniref:Ribosomal RNA small subunit methyltransferase G n=1 Tax=Salipaludibacillus keqinensis TaxID=2045207 RepID=A0A323T6H4_9BACI|nr:16S rRNA (guanine(527)-N(7))-methyltransferase RsmG [Salipaludibacillus keqinensis]PYZ91822.1 16S rRNA (guanine(527)-N(7))-methyltransferase RsmG [Salipaludibacillus keqinensis]
MNEEQFREALQKEGISLTDMQMNQFQRYYEVLVDWNERMNLTAITEKKDVYLKHFYDSITVLFHEDISKEESIIDIGAGAGFPSLPLKICIPHIHVTIVDSLNKRITFLNALAEELDLKGVSFFHDRAEQFARLKNHREIYDVAISRAVARLPVLSELCLPFVKKNGRFIAMKGAGAAEELAQSSRALKLLGGKLENDYHFKLPIEDSERAIIVVRKEKSTPKSYPRKPGTPNKQPLI